MNVDILPVSTITIQGALRACHKCSVTHATRTRPCLLSVYCTRRQYEYEYEYEYRYQRPVPWSHLAAHGGSDKAREDVVYFFYAFVCFSCFYRGLFVLAGREKTFTTHQQDTIVR